MKQSHQNRLKGFTQAVFAFVLSCLICTPVVAGLYEGGNPARENYRDCVRKAKAADSKEMLKKCRHQKKKFQRCVRDAKAAGRKKKMERCRRAQQGGVGNSKAPGRKGKMEQSRRAY